MKTDNRIDEYISRYDYEIQKILSAKKDSKCVICLEELEENETFVHWGECNSIFWNKTYPLCVKFVDSEHNKNKIVENNN